MNIWWMIFLAGLGTYGMRSAGVWIPARLFHAKWLSHLPFAVIFVMAVGSVLSFVNPTSGDWAETWGAIAASLAVVIASLRQLPLIACVTIGCVVFGAIASIAT
jgi:branched-subunit amino acid transport protein